jgi:hypothetical protein
MRINSAIRCIVNGTFSDGFNTKQFPQAIATGHIHIGTNAGKLNGQIPATTPSGTRSV